MIDYMLLLTVPGLVSLPGPCDTTLAVLQTPGPAHVRVRDIVVGLQPVAALLVDHVVIRANVAVLVVGVVVVVRILVVGLQ